MGIQASVTSCVLTIRESNDEKGVFGNFGPTQVPETQFQDNPESFCSNVTFRDVCRLSHTPSESSLNGRESSRVQPVICN
jgi:hypothetical protein